ncbi:MAG: redox-regulated ATPase YchF [bacterium]
MALQIGIVGLPNVGKSTLFRALTKKQVDCANFPFCTIDPNVGVVSVPDERLEKLAKRSNSGKIIPAAVEFVDIAGLVRGASKGEGLGNKFLQNIREVDAIIHVVRVFADPNVIHVENRVDPKSDIATIDIELALADLAVVDKAITRVNSLLKSGTSREAELESKMLARIKEALGKGVPARSLEYNEDELALLKLLQLLTAKPVLFVANVDEAEASKTPDLGIKDPILPLCVKIEAELAELPKEEAKEYLTTMGLSMTGLDRLIAAGYELLNLISYFTSGEMETRAWTITRGFKAPKAAGVIHTDFERTFIRAEIIDWKDFVELGETGAKEAGKLRIEGKDYVMRDGDVAHFRVGA